MKSFFPGRAWLVLGLFLFILVLSPIQWIGIGGTLRPSLTEAKITEETIIFDEGHPAIRAVMAVQSRHTPDLMALPEVVGTATGLTRAGRPGILVFTKDRVGSGLIPRNLEGIPVVVRATGEIFPMPRPPGKGKEKEQVDPASWFDRAVPIGVSTGNMWECSAGTIGARVTDGTNVYALSNNHVYALENQAEDGDLILQPGRYDTNCLVNGDNKIGTLHDFVTIDFDGGTNYVDAAIALSSTDDLDKATPSDGYGAPKSAAGQAILNAQVQKYGRTTGLTKGIIVGIGAIVEVTYQSGTATFADQIVVFSGSPFIQPGDSGSLLISATKRGGQSRKPIGLLFAGSLGGFYGFANPIGLVLESFGVSIDGD